MAQWLPSEPIRFPTVISPRLAAAPAEASLGAESNPELCSSLWHATGYEFTSLIDPQEDQEQALTLEAGEMWTGLADEEHAFIVTQGRLMLIPSTPVGKGDMTATLTPGAIVGNLLLPASEKPDDYQGAGEVIALELCSGYLLPRSLLQRRAATGTLPPLGITLRGALRTRRLTNHPLFVLFRPLSSRLAGILLYIAEEYPGKPIWTRKTHAVRVSPENLAGLVGGEVSEVIALLEDWKSRGWVGRLFGRLVLLDEPALRELSHQPLSI